MDTRVYRVCVVEQFIDNVGSLLEEGSYRLTYSWVCVVLDSKHSDLR